MRMTSFLSDQRGSAIATTAISLMMIAGVAGLAIDMGYAYLLRNRLQATADAAALAGATRLPDIGDVRDRAQEYAAKNMSVAGHGTVLPDAAVTTGRWDAVNKQYTAGVSPPNAVQIVTRRSSANGNAASTFFARIIGSDSLDIEAEAVALYINSGCLLQGVLAGGSVNLAQNTYVESGNCIYGAGGVHFSQNSTVEDGAFIASDDIGQISYDQGFSATAGSLQEIALDLDALFDAEDMIDQIAAESDLPDQITDVVVTDTIPDNPVSGTAYIVNGDVEIDKEFTATDIIIAVRGNLEIGQSGRIYNGAGVCTNEEIAIGLIATGNVHVSQNSILQGVQAVAGGNFELDQNASFEGTVIVGGDASISQSPTFTDCVDAFETPTVNLVVKARLVS